MMNEGALTQFNDALTQVADENATLFSFLKIDTTAATGTVDTNTTVLRELLPRIRE